MTGPLTTPDPTGCERPVERLGVLALLGPTPSALRERERGLQPSVDLFDMLGRDTN